MKGKKKMKKIIAGLLMFAMLAALTVVGVSALTPSVTEKDATINSATINGTNVSTEIAVTPLKDSSSLSEAAKKELDDAVKALEESIPEVSGVTGDYKVGAVIDISYSGTETVENAVVKVNIDLGDAENVQAIYLNTETKKWDNAECEYADGVATLTMKHFCPVAFLVEEESVIVSDPSVNPPQTGDDMSTAVVALGALLVSGAAALIVCRKRENA